VYGGTLKHIPPMEVTEHYGNFLPEWQKDEIQALMELVKKEILNGGDKSTNIFYAKIYGKLVEMRYDV